jgi:hypothetical protein
VGKRGLILNERVIQPPANRSCLAHSFFFQLRAYHSFFLPGLKFSIVFNIKHIKMNGKWPEYRLGRLETFEDLEASHIGHSRAGPTSITEAIEDVAHSNSNNLECKILKEPVLEDIIVGLNGVTKLFIEQYQPKETARSAFEPQFEELLYWTYSINFHLAWEGRWKCAYYYGLITHPSGPAAG